MKDFGLKTYLMEKVNKRQKMARFIMANLKMDPNMGTVSTNGMTNHYTRVSGKIMSLMVMVNTPGLIAVVIQVTGMKIKCMAKVN